MERYLQAQRVPRKKLLVQKVTFSRYMDIDLSVVAAGRVPKSLWRKRRR